MTPPPIRLEPNSGNWPLFRQIARLHSTEILHGLLPLLGERSVAGIYYAAAGAPQSGVWAIVDSGTVLGFVAGTANVRRTIMWVVAHAWASLILGCFRALLRPSLILRIYLIIRHALRHRGTNSDHEIAVSDEDGSAELLSIAVKADCHRMGIGRALVSVLEDGLRSWKVPAYYVSTNRDDPVSNRFYSSRGFVPVSVTKHPTLFLQRYRKVLFDG